MGQQGLLAAAPCSSPLDPWLSNTSVCPEWLYKTCQKLHSFGHLDGIMTFGSPASCVEHLVLLWPVLDMYRVW